MKWRILMLVPICWMLFGQTHKASLDTSGIPLYPIIKRCVPVAKCKQWKGEHQQFKFVLKGEKIYAECGSCGELLPIRIDYGKDAVSFKIRIKFR